MSDRYTVNNTFSKKSIKFEEVECIATLSYVTDTLSSDHRQYIRILITSINGNDKFETEIPINTSGTDFNTAFEQSLRIYKGIIDLNTETKQTITFPEFKVTPISN